MTSSCCSVGHRGPEVFPEAQYSSHTDSDMYTWWSAPLTLSVRVLPSLFWGTGARYSRRRWAAAAGCHGRQECGKRASEGGHDCFTSSIIVTGFAPLSHGGLALGHKDELSDPQNKPLPLRRANKTWREAPLAAPRRPGHSSRFSIQLQRKQV